MAAGFREGFVEADAFRIHWPAAGRNGRFFKAVRAGTR
jgi:hypothetical protein